MNKESQQVNPYPIRLTHELRERLEIAAKQAGRSLNAEMLLRLELSFKNEVEAFESSNVLTEERVREIFNEILEPQIRHLEQWIEITVARKIDPQDDEDYLFPHVDN